MKQLTSILLALLMLVGMALAEEGEVRAAVCARRRTANTG